MKKFLTVVLTGLTALTAATSARADDNWAKINQQLDFNHDGYLDEADVLAGFMNLEYHGIFDIAAIQKLATPPPPKKSHRIRLQDLGLTRDETTGEIVSALPGMTFSKALTDYDLHPLTGGRVALGAINPQLFGLSKPAPLPPANNPGEQTPPIVANAPGLNPMPKSPKVSLTRSTSDLLVGVNGSQLPAYLSWVKNDRNGSNQVLVQGLLAADIGWQENSDQGYSTKLGKLGLDQVHLLPSISFDKATNQTDTNNNVDSLVFREGTKALWLDDPTQSKDTPDPKDIVNKKDENRGLGLVTSGSLDYATDFEFREEIPTAELDIVPIYNNWGLGELTQDKDSPVQVQEVLDLHLEAGDVVDRGSNTKLRDNAGYIRGGPQLGLTLIPSGNVPSQVGPITFKPSDLTFNVSYLYYARAAGIEGNAHLLQASSAWAISGSDNMSLVITYRNGITALQLQSAHTLSVGLGIKF